MNKLIVAGVVTLMSTSAMAETVTDHFKSIIEQTPYRVEVCRDVSVSGDKTGDTLKGAIIGGIIGNNVGDIKNGGAAGRYKLIYFYSLDAWELYDLE